MVAKNTIFLIEDDQVLLGLYKKSLESADFIVHTAGDGEEGKKLLSSLRPDLILLDILLPRMDGYSFLQWIRSDSKAKDIPVIIFSNLSQKEEIERGYKLGADDYIIKTSITPGDLAKRVKEFLHEQKKYA